MRSPEGHEKADIRAFLKQNNIWFFNPATGGFGSSGIPDICGCYRSTFFAVEVKREGKQPTALQWKRMEDIEQAGGKTFWGTADRVIAEMKAWLGDR